MGRKKNDPLKTVLDQIETDNKTGCWLFKGFITGHGYGRVGTSGKNLLAHRIVFDRLVKPIPKGLMICHKCDVRNCVNPDHLFLGTARDNVHDMIAKGRNASSCSIYSFEKSA